MSRIELEGLPKDDHQTRDDLAELFINDVPLLDLRAPVEFKQGSFPTATNIPLMTDEERKAVGIEYKEHGQDSAILLGAKFVDKQAQAQLKEAWSAYLGKNPGGALFCFRGGLRSQISQQWIEDETSINMPRVAGGYKAMRRFLIDSIDRISQSMSVIMLGGRTGSGKTRLLKSLNNSIDLEGLANHRGSAFGPTATPQPTQINFENRLAIELLKKEAQGCQFIVLEDEGRNIGSVGLPQSLFNAMQTSPIIMLEEPTDVRIRLSVDEYIVATKQMFVNELGETNGIEALVQHLFLSLKKIKKRLGGVRYKNTHESLQKANDEWLRSGKTILFESIVTTLLLEYYDPMYDFQSRNKTDRICFKGNRDGVVTYLSAK